MDSYHTFSFGSYNEPRYIGFRDLLVLNENRVQPGYGFPVNAHQDVEILSYVLKGTLMHEDSLGTHAIICPGEMGYMSAGTGIAHSEFNVSTTEAHLLQIWLVPEQEGLPPVYEQKTFPYEERRNALHLVASRDGRDGSLTIHQDAVLYLTALDAGQQVVHYMRKSRHAWAQVMRGEAMLNSTLLNAGDGVAVREEEQLVIAAINAAEVLLLDLA
jgi:hypothetical protein